MARIVLETQNLKKHFGGLKALNGVSIKVNECEVLGIIGPNGAGKTTLFNTICGVYPPTEGKVILRENEEIQGLPPHKIAYKGIARTFQITRIFKDMTVFDNIITALGLHEYETLSGFFRVSKTKANVKRTQELLELLDLVEQKNMLAGELNLASMRRLEIARSLALNPLILMLDEPVAGLDDESIKNLTDLIIVLRKKKITIILVEHNLTFVNEVCDRLTVLNFGEIIAEGSPSEIKKNKAVIEAYLGKEGEESA